MLAALVVVLLEYRPYFRWTKKPSATWSLSVRFLEIEVESLDELSEAIAAQPDWIMLDNFDDASLQKAVASTPSSIKLEVSGGIESDDDIKRIASLGVDYISIGAMTKHIQATDLSLRMTTTPNK